MPEELRPQEEASPMVSRLAFRAQVIRDLAVNGELEAGAQALALDVRQRPEVIAKGHLAQDGGLVTGASDACASLAWATVKVASRQGFMGSKGLCAVCELLRAEWPQAGEEAETAVVPKQRPTVRIHGGDLSTWSGAPDAGLVSLGSYPTCLACPARAAGSQDSS